MSQFRDKWKAFARSLTKLIDWMSTGPWQTSVARIPLERPWIGHRNQRIRFNFKFGISIHRASHAIFDLRCRRVENFGNYSEMVLNLRNGERFSPNDVSGIVSISRTDSIGREWETEWRVGHSMGIVVPKKTGDVRDALRRRQQQQQQPQRNRISIKAFQFSWTCRRQ